MSRLTVALQVSAAILACLVPAVTEAETVVVHVGAETGPMASATAEPSGTVEIVVSYGADDGQSESRTVQLPGRIDLDLPGGVTARIAVAADGWWAQPKVVHVDGPVDVRLLLAPTGWIAGTLRIPSGEEMPERLLVKARAAAEVDRGEASREVERSSPDSSWDCPVEASSFRCAVPHGRLDLRLRAKGFVSHHRWGVVVKPHEVTTLGPLALRPGASIIGWVAAPSDDFHMNEVRVHLRPLTTGPSPSSLDRERASTLRRATTVNPVGFFEIASVAPGSYEVLVEHEDFAATRISPVKVLERAETEIHRITLVPAVEIEVLIDPPMHPFREPWRVELLQQGDIPGHLDVVAEGVSTSQGEWRQGGLAPGDYELRVGDGRGARWATQQVTLEQWGLPVEVELPFDRLEGTLRLAGEPVAATLHFGGRHGATRIPIPSDEDGKFYVFLPRRDEPWLADVVAPEIGLDVQVEGIEVRKLPGDPWAKTVIDLPDTRVFGTVVDESDTALDGAVVEVVGPEGDYLATTRTSGEDGEFEFTGLDPGPASVQARLARSGRRLSSDRVAVEVGDPGGAQALRLVLREDVVIDGLVLSPQGRGVPGAQVLARLHDPHGTLLAVMPASTTDVDGVFTLRLPRGAEQVILSVLAPGYAVHAAPVDPFDDRPLLVELDPAGGTVVVSYTDRNQTPAALLRHRTDLFGPHLVAHSGALRQWAELHGEIQGNRYVLPMLEPGPYTACYDVGFSVLSTGWLPAGGLPDRCVSGVLAPHGQLHLTVPVPNVDREATSE